MKNIVLYTTVFAVGLNLAGYISEGRYSDVTLPEQPDGVAYLNVGTTASSTAEVIMAFPHTGFEAPAPEKLGRPTLPKKSKS